MSFAYLPPWMMAGIAAQGLLAIVGLCGIVVLRFARRGGARFAIAPAMAAVALMPLALGAAVTAYALYEAVSGLAMTGSGGIAAVSAGLAESMLALVIGFVSTAGLAFVAGLVTLVGSSRGTDAPGAGIGGPMLLLVLMGLAGVVVAFLWTAVNEVSALNPSQHLAQKIYAAGGGSVVLLVLLGAMIVVGAWRAARGRTSILLGLVSLALIGLIGVGSLGGVWLVKRRMDCFQRAALTGTACDDLDILPTPATGEATHDVVEAPPPPPPPPPPLPSAVTKEEPSRREMTRGSAGGAVRVGGAIKEPKKLKTVNPVYPDIAKQARVQGVVVLECTISPQGKVIDVKILRGIPLLEAAAVDAVRQWEYTPTLLEGVAVPVIMTVTVSFRLS